ncbi:MAG: hypothetical protein AAFX58_00305 [Pseudomonadota bacterium]
MSETLGEIARRQQLADRHRGDPLLDPLLAELLALAEEVCVLRDRLDSVERLLGEGATPDRHAIDAYEPDADTASARLARHREFFEALFARLDGGEPT